MNEVDLAQQVISQPASNQLTI